MDINELEQLIHVDVIKRFKEYTDSQVPPEPPTIKVSTTQELLAALATEGNIIELAQGVAEFYNPAGFIVPSNTQLRAPFGGTIRADNQPSIRVKPFNSKIALEGFTALSEYNGAVIQLGDNVASTQGTPESVPTFITVKNITIPTHRGKRGIEVNAGDVLIQNNKIIDVYAAAGVDSQAVCVLNSPGRVTIDKNELSAGSENIMLGGDSMKVPGQIINDVIISNNNIYKPLSWQTDGINRGVKNLVEIKAGRNIQILNNVGNGSWRAGQDGYAIVITPKNSQFIENVTVDNFNATNVAAGLNILGEDYNTVTPQPLAGVKIINSSFDVSMTKYGGRGILALITGGTKDVTFDNVTFKGDGTSIIVSDSQKPQGPCLVRGGTMTYLKYGVVMPGSNYGDPLDPSSPYYNRRLMIEFLNNTFTGTVNSRFKTNFPNNIYPAA